MSLPKFSLAGFILVLLLNFVPEVLAGQFEQAYIRFDRLQVSTATGGLVCATPEAVGTENKVVITFPTNFTVNTTASNWTIDGSADLPAGATAWPGIGEASSVSGKTVTFPSGDLNVGTQYCFNFSGINTLTTPGSVNNDLGGTIATQTAGSAVIDSVGYNPLVTSSDQVTVTATVPTNVSAYSTQLANLSGNGPFSQSTTINYQITYGTTSVITQPITLQASWTQGDIQGSSSSPIDILSYVVGSASNAYNGAPPVIDTVNRTITWTIPSFPAMTSDQTVTFSLITGSYSGSNPVQFSVSSSIEVGGDYTPNSTVTSLYQYSQSSGGGSSSSSSSNTSTPSSQAGPAAPIAGPRPAFRILGVEMLEIEKNRALIAVTLNQLGKVEVRYGTDIKKLNQSITSLSVDDYHEIELQELLDGQIYFFRLYATASNGTRIVSDLFTFKTSSGDLPEVLTNKIILLSGTNILDSTTPAGGIGSLESPVYKVVLPINTEYEFRVPIKNYENIKSVKAYLKSNEVLGVSSEKPVELNTEEVGMLEIYPGVYSGKLKSTEDPGRYTLYVQIEDYNGAVVREPVIEILVVQPMKILDGSGEGIENAMVKLYFYNSRTRTYEELSADAIGIKNPVYSEPDGTVKVTLPSGKYQAEITALRYKSETVDFEIGPLNEENYPQIELEKEGFSFITYFKYYSEAFKDFYRSLSEFMTNLTGSQRMFDLASFLALSLLVILTIFTFSFRINTPIWRIRDFIFYLALVVGIRKRSAISGSVKHLGESVSGAEVSLMDGNKVLDQVTTGRNGKFVFGALQGDRVVVSKPGYDIAVMEASGLEARPIELEKNNEAGEFLKNSERVFEDIFGACFEIVLLFSFVFELVFIKVFGLWQVLPYLIISLMNFAIWVIYLRRMRIST